MRSLFTATLLVCAASAHAGDATHYIDLVNTAPDSIVSFAIAPSGTNQFRTVALAGGALHGGGDSATIAVANGAGTGCLHDLRIEFANGRTLIQKNFDVCKYRSYHTGRYLRGRRRSSLRCRRPHPFRARVRNGMRALSWLWINGFDESNPYDHRSKRRSRKADLIGQT